MKQMSLKSFKEKYFPNMQKQKFSAMLGFDNSLISKIMNGSYDCNPSSPRWVELVNVIKRDYEVEIIPSSKFMAYAENKEKTIKRLEQEVAELKKDKEELEEIISVIMGSVRVVEEAKKGVSYGKFKLEQYRSKKGK